MYAVSRIIAAVSRQHLLPPVLARVHRRFGTPYISTLLSGVATAVIALFTSFDELIHLVSMSWWLVCQAPERQQQRCSGHMLQQLGASVPGYGLMFDVKFLSACCCQHNALARSLYAALHFCRLILMSVTLQVSISTLFAFWIVGLALLWRRYYSPSNTTGRNVFIAAHLLLLIGTSLGEFVHLGRSYDKSQHTLMLAGGSRC